MSEEGAPASAARRAGAGAVRVGRAWRKLPPERRLAAVAAILLFFSLFFPWYQETVISKGTSTRLQSASASLTGWGAFSFVEAAVLLVAGGVLVLLYQRAEGRAFHIPGGDGGVITVAGVWACVLIIWRIFDKQDTSGQGQFATTSGIEWGILVALGLAGLLAYAGSRIRTAHAPEPPLPGESPAPPPVDSPRPRRARPPLVTEDEPTLHMDDRPVRATRTRPVASDEQPTVSLDDQG